MGAVAALLQLIPVVAPSDWATGYRLIAERLNALIKRFGGFQGGSNDNVKNFGAGYVAYGGLDNSLRGNIQFEFGTNLPNPSGIPGAVLLLGSGGGSFTGSITGTVLTVTATLPGAAIGVGCLITGSGVAKGTGIISVGTGAGGVGTYNLNVSQTVASGTMYASAAAWILTDQAFHNDVPGDFLGIVAGETQGAGVGDGGELFCSGGGSFGGTGGPGNYRGGTSANARAGDATLAGGDATGATSAAIAGNAVVSSGQVGKVPGLVILSANKPPGSTGVSVIRHQYGSASGTELAMDEFPDGSIFLYDLTDFPSVSRGGFGNVGDVLVSGGPGAPTKWQNSFTGDIPPGSTIHVANGLITGFT